MRTQEFVHTVNPAMTTRSYAPGILTTRTNDQIGRIDEAADWNAVRVKTKQFRTPGQSTRFGGSPKQHSAPPVRAPHRWGIILAGGDGVRLRGLTRSVFGDDRPKQFCPLLGSRTLLEEARQRAERSLPAEQILYSLTRAHENYYLHDLADRPSQRIVQPINKGTAPAILYALLRIAQTDSDAIVSILPCDHYYSSESAFTATLESALEIAEQQAGSVVLLGAQPNGPEVEYGWIEIGEAVAGRSGLFHVAGFREKPPLDVAQALFGSGSLWNTFVMVGHVRAFLDMAWATVPGLLQVLEVIKVKPDPGEEVRIPNSIYDRITSVDFSRQVLSPAADRLLTFRLNNIDWSDLGDPFRVLVTLVEKTGDLPGWAKLWPEPESIPHIQTASA